jgi:hypothetical protein
MVSWYWQVWSADRFFAFAPLFSHLFSQNKKTLLRTAQKAKKAKEGVPLVVWCFLLLVGSSKEDHHPGPFEDVLGWPC